MIYDTIAAISSGGKINQAISIIRVSGPESIEIVKKVFSGKVGSNMTITYGWIKDNFNNNAILDEVLVAWFIGKNNFVGEDTVEINCHGGVVITNQILELLLANGARLALPGEFSRRSFLNGKMDLIKAEAINELIHATTTQQTSKAINKFDGKTSELINNFITKLTYLIGQMEVNIDYPEYDDVENVFNDELVNKLENLNNELQKVIQASENSRYVFEGIKVAIVGKPNVGKSSLLNALINEDKAIVTDEAGTTRDIVEATYQIDGLLLKLIDTAGIRNTDKKIESIGIEKSLQQIEAADLVIHLHDLTQKNNEYDNKIAQIAKDNNKHYLAVYNKIDLINVLEDNKIYISAINKNIEALIQAIKTIFKEVTLNTNEQLNNARQLSLIKKASLNLHEAINALNSGVEIDLVIVDIREAWFNLMDITGRADNEYLLDEMFKNFCLGK